MRVPRLATDIAESVIRLLYPPCCRACGEALEEDNPLRLCSNCVSEIDTIEGSLCEQCGHPLMSEDSIHGERCRSCPDGTLYYRAARAALAYGTPVRALIHAFKFRFHSGLGPHLASYLTAPYWRRFQGEIDAIVPVPLHWLRLRWREFNQSEELARHLGEKVQVPVVSDWLRRVRFTRTQSRLRTRSAKRRNVQNAFKVIAPG
jgi:predicted amidophosphoribosyltransferase